MIAILLALFGILILPFKLLFRFFRKSKKRKSIFFSIAAGAIIFFVIFTLYGIKRDNKMETKVIVLGVDGFEPKIVEELMKEGKLPNFSRLKEIGAYSHMATTMPAESPVAWSSFITGTNPGGHGIFDFLLRDPKTYMPYLTLSKFEPPKRSINVGNKKIFLDKAKIVSYRKGTPFWRILSQKGISSVILRCPVTFPPEKIKGRMLSGFGVPDIMGTQGTFSFYTREEIIDPEGINSKIFPVSFKNGKAETFIRGPKDRTLKKPEDMKVPLYLELNEEKKKLKILFQNKEIELGEGEWSPWQRIRFRRGLVRVNAICHFYLQSIEPEFGLYLSPLNFDPEKPSFPISYPASFSKELAREIGLYCTLGEPGETWALNEGRIDDEAVVQQYYQVLGEREKMLFTELKKFRSGLFFCYFGVTDTIQHMFWRTIDRESPLYDEFLVKKNIIPDFYQAIDKILGKVMKKYVDDNTTLILFSDHGFSAFHRVVHLNTYLKENNFLRLKKDKTSSGEFLENVDWKNTKAYGLGFAGIYINQKGREKYGIVEVGEEKRKLEDEIIKKLREIRDPKNGKEVIKNVYRKEDIYHGPYLDNAPDLIVGYNACYRASWQTVLGGVPVELIEDNKKKWSGDHIIDSSLVPAILFVNKKMNSNNPRIIDIAPTILGLFDIEVPKEMDGKPLGLIK